MEDIVIPMTHGNMDDIEQDGNMTEGASESQSDAMDSSNVPNSQTVYEREDRYSSLLFEILLEHFC